MCETSAVTPIFTAKKSLLLHKLHIAFYQSVESFFIQILSLLSTVISKLSLFSTNNK